MAVMIPLDTWGQTPALFRWKAEVLEPRLFPCLTLDLDASVGVAVSGTNVTAWTNAAGGLIVFTNDNPNTQPSYTPNFLNGRPGVRFNGTNQALETWVNLVGSPTSYTNQQTVFCVLSNNNTGLGGAHRALVQCSTTITNYISFTAGRYGTAKKFTAGAQRGFNTTAVNSIDSATHDAEVAIIAGVWDGTNVSFWKGGTNKNSNAFSAACIAADPNTNGWSLGAGNDFGTNTYFFHGTILRLLHYNTNLNDMEMTNLFFRLNQTYCVY